MFDDLIGKGSFDIQLYAKAHPTIEDIEFFNRYGMYKSDVLTEKKESDDTKIHIDPLHGVRILPP